MLVDGHDWEEGTDDAEDYGPLHGSFLPLPLSTRTDNHPQVQETPWKSHGNQDQPRNEGLAAFTCIYPFLEQCSVVKPVGTSEWFKHANNPVSRTLHKHLLPSNKREMQVVIRAVQVLQNCHGLKYPYTFRTAHEVLGIFGDTMTAGMYAWDSGSMVGI